MAGFERGQQAEKPKSEVSQSFIAEVMTIANQYNDTMVEHAARFVEALPYTSDGRHSERTPKEIADLLRLFKCATPGDRPGG